MDAVAGLLDGPRARGAFLLRLSFGTPWALRIQDEAPLAVLSAVRGASLIIPAEGEPVRLEAGDVAIARGPAPYTVADDPATPIQAIVHPGQACTTPQGEELKLIKQLGTRTWGNAPDGATVLMTGVYESAGEISARLLRALPPLLEGRRRRARLAARPAAGGRDRQGRAGPGGRPGPSARPAADRHAARLVRARRRAGVVPRVLRPGRRSGAAGAPRRAGAPVDRRRAGEGRRRLARRARPPLQRPRRRAADELPHRLADRARRRPAAGAGRDVGSVAAQVGYGSPFALSTAFKRLRGVSPQQYRTAAT